MLVNDAAATEKPAPTARVCPFHQTAFLLAASGILTCAAFFPQGYGLAVFVALVPALLAARRAPLKRLFLFAWATGYLTALFLYYWIAIVTVPGWLLLPLYLGLYLSAFLVAVEVAARRLAVPRLVSAIALWPLLELLRGRLFTGLPWFYLGHALYRWPRLVQAADLGGVIFVSAVIIAVNALVAQALDGARGRRARIGAVVCAALLVVANLAYGARRLACLEVLPGPTVAIVQPNVPQDLKIKHTPEDAARMFADLRAATLADDARSADVIFWPETIMPGLVGIEDYWVAVGMEPLEVLDELELQGAIDRSGKRRVLELVSQGGEFVESLESVAGAGITKRVSTGGLLAATARIAGRPLVAGAIAAVFAEAATAGPGDSGSVARTFNRACHFDAAGKSVRFYDKVHLVPFGEFVPFRDSLPPLARLLASMMPVEPLTYPGGDFVVLDIGGYRYGPAICFEDTFSYIARRYRRLGADILVNLTNDGWFGGSFELEVHLANACLRAVETRMAVVRAANTGISAVISPAGSVTVRLADGGGRDRQVSGTLVAEVGVSPDRPAYLKVREWWLAAPAALVLSWVLHGVRRRR